NFIYAPAPSGRQDLLAVTVSGNSGPSPTSIRQPGNAKNVVTVGAGEHGAVGMTNGQDFSGTGPTPDGRIKPDVMTAGCAFSACGDNTAAACGPSPEPFMSGSGVKYVCGTSQAAPTASGALALIRQYFVECWYPSGRANCAGAQFTEPSAAL